MKIWRLIFAIIAALWTFGVSVGVVTEMGKHGGTRGIVESAAGLGATAALLALTIWLFSGVMKKSIPPSNS